MKQQANSKNAGDRESLPPASMHKWEITCFLPARVLNGTRVSPGGAEEGPPQTRRSPALTVAGDSGRSHPSSHWMLDLSCSMGLPNLLLSSQQQPELGWCVLAEPSCTTRQT